MNKKEILIIAGSIIVPTYIAHKYIINVSEESLLGFLTASPTLIGIILASALTSLAIILAIIGENEMIKIQELERKRNVDFYKHITKNLRHDIYFILGSFIISTFLVLFCVKNISIIIPIKNGISIDVFKIIFIIDSALLIISFIATYDIINGLFDIFDFKYELANKSSDKDEAIATAKLKSKKDT
jgi:hypothetical protein